jgi:hypothetical protein
MRHTVTYMVQMVQNSEWLYWPSKCRCWFQNLKSRYQPFHTGRAAIVANDYATRDTQIDIIKTKIALVPAVRAVFIFKKENQN